MRAMTGLGDREIEAEVDRYMVLPGQALAYTIGMLRIVELRQTAQQALGRAFELRAFHEAVLRHGALPLPLLQQQVEAYIRDNGG